MKKLLLTALLTMPIISFAPAMNIKAPTTVTSAIQEKNNNIQSFIGTILANIQKGVTKPRETRLQELNEAVTALITGLQDIAPQNLTEDAKNSVKEAYNTLTAEADTIFDLYAEHAFAKYFEKYQNKECKSIRKIQATIAMAKKRIDGFSVMDPVYEAFAFANKNWKNRCLTVALTLAAYKTLPYMATFAYYKSGIFGQALKWCITPGAVYAPAAKQA